MQFHISTDKDSVTVYADVVKIEVEDIIGPDEDDPDEHYFRTIRFVGYSGELHRVKELNRSKSQKSEIGCSNQRFISQASAKRSSSFSTNCQA